MEKLTPIDIDESEIMYKNYYRKAKHIRCEQTYTLDMYISGLSYRVFKRRAKDQLLSDVLNSGDIEFISVRFSEESLNAEEIFDEILKYRREDGQYYCKGVPMPSEAIKKWVEQTARVIRLTGRIALKE